MYLCCIRLIICYKHYTCYVFMNKIQGLMFQTRLLTSEDEYKWYWHQMIYFPETINTISTMNIYITNTFTFISLAEHINSLCACWHPEALKGSSSSSSCCLLVLSRITSPLFPCPGSTDAPCSRLGDPVPPSPKWRPHSQGPRTLPYRDPEQLRLNCVIISM